MNETQRALAIGILVLAVLTAGVVRWERVSVAPRRERVASFTARFVAPHNKLTLERSGMTLNHVGNHLIWVACMQPADSCAALPCLHNALGRNATAAEALCAAVRHDCPAQHCVVAHDCNSMGPMLPTLAALYVLPCDGEPSGDYEYSQKIIGLD